MHKISIIIPVYNAENYLNKCIDSVLKQTYKDIEVIIINDGSIDKSLEIIRDYEKIDSRIKVIDKKNEGVSKARNVGLEYSTGEFITFIDSDDYIDSDMIENLYNNLVENNSDMCMCNYINEQNGVEKRVQANIPMIFNTNEKIRKQLILQLIERNDGEKNHALSGFRGPWGKLFKKDIIKKYNIKFNEKLAIGEDFLFDLEFLIKSQKVSVDNRCYYHYVNNDTSAIMSYRENCWTNTYKKVITNLKEFLDKNNMYFDAETRFNKLVIKYFFICLHNEKRSKNSRNLKKIIKTIKLLGNDEIIKKAVKCTSIHEFKLREKFMLNLIRIKCYLFAAIVYVL